MSLVAAALAAAVWTAAVEVSPGAGPWAAAPVPGWLELEEELDGGRVRLLDGRGNEVPYRLVDALEDAGGGWIELEAVNLRRTGDGFRFAVELPPGEIVDRLRLAVEGEEGVLAATVLGGEPAGVLVEGVRVGRLQGAAVVEIELPATDLGRLEVELDELLPGLRPVGAALRRARPGRADELPPVRYRFSAAPEVDGRSRLLLAADGPPPRIAALELEIAGPAVFRRRVTVLDRTPGEEPVTAVPIGSAELVRIPLGDGRPGLETTRVPVRPGSWPRLELRAERGSEAPLEVAAVVGVVASRFIVFPRPDRASSSLRLGSGATRRSLTLERGPMTVELGAAASARIGSPMPAEVAVEGGADAGAVWTSLLFVLVAALLGWLAWRVFARP